MDPIYMIREAATNQLQRLTETFGVPWFKKSILPRVIAMGAEKTYLSRLTTLFVIMTVGPIVDGESNTKEFLPALIRLAKDPVPNVRFNAARAIQKLMPKLDKGYVRVWVSRRLGSVPVVTHVIPACVIVRSLCRLYLPLGGSILAAHASLSPPCILFSWLTSIVCTWV